MEVVLLLDHQEGALGQEVMEAEGSILDRSHLIEAVDQGLTQGVVPGLFARIKLGILDEFKYTNINV